MGFSLRLSSIALSLSKGRRRMLGGLLWLSLRTPGSMLPLSSVA
jgi:hypothetical protein